LFDGKPQELVKPILEEAVPIDPLKITEGQLF
jgi:hypothetical protein